jgi:hypothetical protein
MPDGFVIVMEGAERLTIPLGDTYDDQGEAETVRDRANWRAGLGGRQPATRYRLASLTLRGDLPGA